MIDLMTQLVSGCGPMQASAQAQMRAQSEAARDVQLEHAIDLIGRERVFARAFAHGWSPPATPPKWVWQGIVDELRAEDAEVRSEE